MFDSGFLENRKFCTSVKIGNWYQAIGILGNCKIRRHFLCPKNSSWLSLLSSDYGSYENWLVNWLVECLIEWLFGWAFECKFLLD